MCISNDDQKTGKRDVGNKRALRKIDFVGYKATNQASAGNDAKQLYSATFRSGNFEGRLDHYTTTCRNEDDPKHHEQP